MGFTKRFRKIICTFLLVLSGLFVFCIPSFACTAFSVKTGDDVYFGKNWDFDPARQNEVRIVLEELPDGRSCLYFLLGGFVCSAITSDGFYSTCNENQGANGPLVEYDENIMVDIGHLRENLMNFSTIDGLKEYIGSRKVVCMGYPEHVLFADRTGKACLVETDNSEDYLIDDSDGVLVATNFFVKNMESPDKPGDSGCWRYEAAYNTILENRADFNADTAALVLKNSIQSGFTIYSFVYSIKENSVYLYLKRDFEKVWKFSFDTQELTTFKGFDEQKSFVLDSEGVMLSRIMLYQSVGIDIESKTESKEAHVYSGTDYKKTIFNEEYFWGIIVAALISGAVITCVVVAKSKKKK